MPFFYLLALLVCCFVCNSIILVSSYPKYAENANSCVDSCGAHFEPKYKLDLDRGSYETTGDNELVEILDDFQVSSSSLDASGECSKNVLLRIPFYKLLNGTIAKIEFEYGDLPPKGITFHVGNSPTNDLNGGDRNTTMYNSEVYANETNMDYYMSSASLCDQGVSIEDPSMDLSKLLFINETQSYIDPRAKIVLYVTEKWFRVDNLERNTSIYYNNKYLFTFSRAGETNAKCETSSLNQAPYNKPSPYLYVGLNRMIADRSLGAGSGLCSAHISFLNCHAAAQPDLEIDVAQMDFRQRDREHIAWISHLSFLEPSMEHSPCSGQGVVKLKFDPNGTKKVARFDLTFGDMLSGFTFNLGDSPTNNAYGGDSGSTSNSAEIHSNDNRFYVWLNTKYCGDTLLYKIEYNLFQNEDEFTLFVSDQRLEITNNRGYHEIFKSPFLYNLNGQNVTCNCFDTRCYPGVQPDDELYFGINRVIGGVYRPGIGLCRAKITWLQCLANTVRRNESDIDSELFVDWASVPRSLFKPSSFVVELEENRTAAAANTTTTDVRKQDDSIMVAVKQTEENVSFTADPQQQQQQSTILSMLTTPTSDVVGVDVIMMSKNASSESVPPSAADTEADELAASAFQIYRSGGSVPRIFSKGQYVVKNQTTDDEDVAQQMMPDDDTDEGESLEASSAAAAAAFKNSKDLFVSDVCNEENMKNDLLYHEYPLDSAKFIFCESVNRPRVLKCPFEMKWSQVYQQCLLES